MISLIILKSILAALAVQCASAACANDNLLNAFIRTPTPAAAFCSTYTLSVNSAVPTFVATTYGAARYSSACSCVATSTIATNGVSTVTTVASCSDPNYTAFPTLTLNGPTFIACAPTATITVSASAETITLPASISTVT